MAYEHRVNKALAVISLTANWHCV